MRESLERLCREFIGNRDAVKGAFVWDNATLYPVSAAVFCEAGIVCDGERMEKMKRCRTLLKDETGIFHDFRGYAQLVTCAILAADGSPEDRLSRALELYRAFRAHFRSSQYLPVASMMLSGIVPRESHGALAERARRIYDLMKTEHPFLTSAEDSVFAAMLALSKERDADVVREVERCYGILKKEFFSANAVQSLSHVLALQEGSAEEKCGKVLSFYRLLRERGRKYGTDYELATLGVLALLPAPCEELLCDLCATDDHLRLQRGYGVLGLTARQRLMHAGMLVTLDRLGKDGIGTAAAVQGAIASAVAMAAAQQAALLAVIAAASSSGS